MKKIAILVVLLVLGAVSPAGAQEFFFKKNLANIRVDKISESEILKFKSQFENSNLSEQQAMELLLSRGMSKAEVDKMRKKLTSTGGVNGQDVLLLKIAALRDSLRGGSDISDVFNSSQLKKNIFKDTLIYGSELFAHYDPSKDNFAPNLRLATPSTYSIGPGDKLTVAIYGSQEAVTDAVVSPEGNVNLPYGGMISVGGTTIEEATARIKKRLSVSGYSSLASGQSKINVVLAEVRTIRVVVVGARRPGSYFLPAVASAMHLLYQSGGPGAKGSFRQIEVIRQGTVVATLDLYALLSTGKADGDITLKEGDIVRVPTYGARVNLSGLVKKPGLYEALPGESLEKLMQYAGGLSEPAYGGRVLVYRTGIAEREVLDVPLESWSTHYPKAGDVVIVGSLLKRFANRVYIAGAVMRPGVIGWDSTLTVASALSKVEGLREDALERGVIYRHSFDGSSSYHGFNTSDPLSLAWELQPSDSLVIGSRLDFTAADSIEVQGFVKKPGVFDFAPGLTLYDALLLSGGWQPEALLLSVEVYSLVKNQSGVGTGERSVKSYAVDPQLGTSATEIILQPGDLISVREDRFKRNKGQIEVRGEAMIPGTYGLVTASESMGALLQRAGGLTPESDPKFGLLLRRKENAIQRRGTFQAQTDSSEFPSGRPYSVSKSGTAPYDSIAIDLTNLRAVEGLMLLSGDILLIPKRSSVVKISGEVNQPTALITNRLRSAKYYIKKAGGFNERASRKKVYVVYPNGAAQQTHAYFWGLSVIYPLVSPGCEVVVPAKDIEHRRKMTLAEWSGLAVTMGTLATVTLGIINLLP